MVHMADLIMRREDYKNFDKIVMYYDNGQETLGTVLDSIFLLYKKRF